MLMSDLVSCEDMSGSVCLYDIDIEAAENNRIIGEKFNNAEGAKSKWSYSVADTSPMRSAARISSAANARSSSKTRARTE